MQGQVGKVRISAKEVTTTYHEPKPQTKPNAPNGGEEGGGEANPLVKKGSFR